MIFNNKTMSNPKIKTKIKHLLSRFFTIKITTKRCENDFYWYSDSAHWEQSFLVRYYDKNRFKVVLNTELPKGQVHLINITDVK